MLNQNIISSPRPFRWFSAALLAATIALPNVVSAGLLGLGGNDARNENLSVIGLTEDGRLVSFKTKSPGRSKELSFVSGLVNGDTVLVGIDYRVANGLLYGVGNKGGVYTIDPNSGQANLITTLTVPLNGNAFGVDFNPAADALRVVSNRGQNLRHPFAGPTMFQTAVDGTLTYPATATAPAIVARGVTGVAYTNNDLDTTTSTTLFALDTKLDQIVVQSPANAGLVQATGSLGVNSSQWAGFDNYSEIQNNKVQFIRGFASLRIGGTSGALYEIELLTGNATPLGSFKEMIVDIAIPLDQ